MPPYKCIFCSYETNRKYNFNKHLNSKKHLQNTKDCGNDYVFTPKPSTVPPKTSKTLHYNCKDCGKEFTRLDNLKRHLHSRCSKKKEENEIIMQQNKQIEQLQKDKKEMAKQIELLLTKVGHNFTTITNNTNTNNNIQLNNYGNEDLSHITDTLKTHLLKQPYGAIQHLIEKIHFNEDKPENTNIMITNKRDNKISVFENGKWVYRNKKKTILGLIDNKYYLLDDHYNDIPFESLSTFNHDNYKRFSGKYDTCEKELLEKLYEDAEIIILNQK